MTSYYTLRHPFRIIFKHFFILQDFMAPSQLFQMLMLDMPHTRTLCLGL